MEGDNSPTAALSRRTYRINLIVLIVLIQTLILIITLFIFPSFFPFTSNITIKSVSIKKGWSSLNILLVLVAVLCGIFAKIYDEVLVKDVIKPQPSDSDLWYECYEREPVKRGSGMRRNSSSYPDLRQASEWDTGYNQFRFFDDFELSTMQYNRRGVRGSKVAEIDRSDTKVISVETSELVHSPPPPTLAAVTPPLHEKVAEQRSIEIQPKHKRKERHIEAEKEQLKSTNLETEVEKRRSGRRKIRNSDQKEEKALPPPQLFPLPTPAPPPPPPPPPYFYNILKKKNKNKKIHSITGQPPPPPPPPPLPMSHIFNNMFKTGRKSKRIGNPYSISIPPPPPPPPPPPQSVFNNMFKTGSKSKRHKIRHSSYVPPPPPPPPPRSIFNNLFKTGNKSKRIEKQHYTPSLPPRHPPLKPLSSVFNDLFKTDRKRQNNKFQETNTNSSTLARPGKLYLLDRQPIPEKKKNTYKEDENPVTRGESLMTNIPPPPPLPPFKMAESGFVAKDDFVRIRNLHSSRGSSPDLEDVDLSYEKKDSEDGLGRSMTCPSPDVNLKADTFITRLKGEWKLEKMSSMKKKQLSPRN